MSRTALFLLLALAAACTQASGPTDAIGGAMDGASIPDGGAATDAAPAEDSGTPAPDSGTPAPDSGTPAPDSGTPTEDAGTPAPDAGTPAAGAPLVLYTDILSGPTSGGEGDQGAYLSIFGRGLGTTGLGTTVKVFLGTSEVARYLSLGTSRGRPDIQQLTVQVGALGGAAPGTALPIRVEVGGLASNTDHRFTVNPGRFLYVDNMTGDDATAIPGDITHPYRYAQRPNLSQGAWGQARPGDFIVLRASNTAWHDVGFEGYFLRYRDKSGTAPTGAQNSGPIVLMGYPGEDVFIRGTLADGMSGGCVSAINGQTYAGMGQWAVVTNLRMDCEGYDGPISQEIYGNHWRVVNNELSASTAPTSGADVPRMAGITGNGEDSVWLGNHIHDIQGSPQECHGIYIDGDGTYEIAYNLIEHIRSGNGFQVYVNGGNGSDNADDISFHHNLIRDISKHGVNLADGTRNNIRVFNNLVSDVDFAALRFNTTDLHAAQIYSNTFVNTNRMGSSNYGALTNDWNIPAGALDVENNIFAVASGTPYNAGSNGVDPSAGTFTHNLWFDGTGSPVDAAPITGDPRFVGTGTDFHLRAGSPAINAGSNSAAVRALVLDDFEQKPRDAMIDVGALER
ncbi:MAG: hypothetical protein U1E65_18860 [Myxococcota bacterium]